MKIAFNKPYLTGLELDYIQQAHQALRLSGDGEFTKKCSEWLEKQSGCQKAALTHSCTGALEMAAILIGTQPGDEIIMPSFTFVSTANAFVLRGGVPVFVDIRSDTLNIDESKIEAAITPRTKAIVPVHYAGVGCDMEKIMAIADRHGLFVIEDAAQGFKSYYRERPLGSIGHLGTLSFHETKNITCGEGGALLVNDERFTARAEIIREKGTNRSQFFRGEVDKYTWVDVGSSFLPSELTAAFLWAQMEKAQEITDRRLSIWQTYHRNFTPLENEHLLRRPIIPAECQHNAHMYYLLLSNPANRRTFISLAKAAGIDVVFHYVPLHTSPAGKRYGRSHGELNVTENIAECLVRLPLWLGIEEQLDDIISHLVDAAYACSPQEFTYKKQRRAQS